MVPPTVYNPDLPASLERIILKCTAKKPENRYGSANDLIVDLRKALIQPDGGYVQDPDAQRALKGQTIQISGKDLARIKEQYTPGREEPVREYVRRPVGETAVTRYQEDRRRTSERRDNRRKPPEDEVNSHIERLLAGAGIVVAILIVAVMIVVFSKLGGLFQSGSGFFNKETITESPDVSQTNELGETLKDSEVYMPDVLELPEDLAEAKLKENFLSMKPTYQASEVVEKGCVISQEPVYGTIVSKYSHVNVVVSLGSDKIDLTTLDLENMSVASARRLLEDRGLTVQLVEEESETVEKGLLLRYEPEKAAENSTVTLYVSTGPHVDLVPVPDLVGKPESEALALLGEAGLTPGATSTENSDTVPKGSIIRQEGGENGQIEVGGTISYVVSSGPEKRQQRYVASINDVYDLSNLIGPGAGGASFTVLVRLHQKEADGTDIYRTLTEAKTISGSTLLPISYTTIESMNGSDEGQVEVVDTDSGAVLKSYPLTFFPMD